MPRWASGNRCCGLTPVSPPTPSIAASLVYLRYLKGIVHPKMKILWLFTHPQVIPNLYEFHSLTKQKQYYGSQCLPATVWLPTFFKISSFRYSKVFFQIFKKHSDFFLEFFFFNHGNSLPFVFLQVFWIFTHKGSHNCLTIGIYYTCELSFFSVKSHG